MQAGGLCRILIVDDELLIRKGIIHYLDWEQEGFTIVGEASNGQEALDLIKKTHPHILITDFVMPIMDGEELIRVVKERYPEIEIIVLSSFSEFDYVRSSFQNGAVDYILKPKLDAESLLKVLKTAASRIPLFQRAERKTDEPLSVTQVINKMISGFEMTWDEESRLKAFPYRYFYLAGVSGQSLESDEFQVFKDTRMGEFTYYSFSPNKSLQVYIINTEYREFQHLLDFINIYLAKEPGMGLVVSEVFEDFFQLGKVYKESLLTLLDYRFYFPKVTVLTSRDVKGTPVIENFNLDWFTDKLKRSQFEPAFTYLKDYAERLSRCYKMDIFEYRAFFHNIIFNIMILLSNMEYDVKELENKKYVYFTSIEEAGNAHEIVLLLDSFIEEARKCLVTRQRHSESFNMKKLIDYLKEHYAEPLTLTEVAKQFHFNPSYLSSYFSSHMHVGFIEYLNKIRIEEAAKLLRENKSSISEISGMVGYSDPSYFCKVFKKIKGISPSRYKRQHT